MSLVDEKLTEQFYAWESRGRGWLVFDSPVALEPPYRPFDGHYLPPGSMSDDGRKHTLISSLAERLGRLIHTQPPEIAEESIEEPLPDLLSRDSLIELQASLPAEISTSREAFAQFLMHASLCSEPLAFELIGRPESVTMQFAAHPTDAQHLFTQMQAHFPAMYLTPSDRSLEDAWCVSENNEAAVVEFGLSQEFMIPLASMKADLFTGLIASLADAKSGELALFQVVFQPTNHPWAESILWSVSDNNGKSFFVNRPKLVSQAEKKVSLPLFAAVVRLAAKSGSFERTIELLRNTASAFRSLAGPESNELIPMRNDDYPLDAHVEDLLRRQSRRTGMLLNMDELISLVHLPSAEVRSAKFQRVIAKTKQAPSAVLQDDGLVLGINFHAGEAATVRLSADQRSRHMHVIGASGTGKSTLLFNLIRQDIENGEGVAVLDPHGDLIDRLLGIIPPDRTDDVILIDPSDEEYSIGFNILSAHSDMEKRLLASDLVSVFERLSTSWGDQMGSVLQNAILAFLESDRGGSLVDLRRFLLEKGFRDEFLKTVHDPEIVYYWQKGFAQLSGNKSIGPVLTRLGTFLSPKPIRNMVSQTESRLDFAEIMDSGKILLARLSQGAMGQENSYLLGSLLVSKFQQLAMSRQQQQETSRRYFWIYVDEFQNFITSSMAQILSGARKYRIGLTLAHHELRQLQKDSDVSSAVLSNAFTRVCFRLGDQDARSLASGFSSFDDHDLQDLSTGEAICRVERSGYDFNLTVPLPEDIDVSQANARRQEVTVASRSNYGTPRADIEAALSALYPAETSQAKETPPALKQAPPSPVAESFRRAAEPSGASEVRKRSASQVPAQLGRGGDQHQLIQQRLKTVAEGLGWRVVVEKPVLDGRGNADLALQMGGTSIAVEITITTTTDQEFGNVAKCLSAGFAHVAVVSPDKRRLEKIKQAVSGSMDAEVTGKVWYGTPDDFPTFLKEIEACIEAAPPEQTPAKETPTPSTVKRRGYIVKRKYAALSPEEQKQREDATNKAIADAMRRKINPAE